MFCPNCRSEFRAGFTHCKKCNKDLVDKLDPLPEDSPVEYEYTEMVTIAETSELFDIALARGALESAHIRFNITNEFTQNLIAASSISGMGNPITASQIMVEKGKEEEARLILEGIMADVPLKKENSDD
jgi:Putative prokaryotic signal transducing protein